MVSGVVICLVEFLLGFLLGVIIVKKISRKYLPPHMATIFVCQNGEEPPYVALSVDPMIQNMDEQYILVDLPTVNTHK